MLPKMIICKIDIPLLNIEGSIFGLNRI